jgi:betaine-aldehyde dehydrogenase
MMALWKIAPPLAAGCTVVFKPSPNTPLTALKLAELLPEAGLPPGVVNIVMGGNDTGRALVEHPDVRMVSVTGSTATGERVMRTAAATLKRLHLELGGKAPVLVFADAEALRRRPCWLRRSIRARTAARQRGCTWSKAGWPR